MRTTLNIDDDVLIALKELARRDSKSLGDVISSLLRQSLTHGHADGRAKSGQESRLQNSERFGAAQDYPS